MDDAEIGRRRGRRGQDEVQAVTGQRVAQALPEGDFGRVELRPGDEQDPAQLRPAASSSVERPFFRASSSWRASSK